MNERPNFWFVYFCCGGFAPAIGEPCPECRRTEVYVTVEGAALDGARPGAGAALDGARPGEPQK